MSHRLKSETVLWEPSNHAALSVPGQARVARNICLDKTWEWEGAPVRDDAMLSENCRYMDQSEGCRVRAG